MAATSDHLNACEEQEDAKTIEKHFKALNKS